jgi:hypothetical protein
MLKEWLSAQGCEEFEEQRRRNTERGFDILKDLKPKAL